MERKRKYLKGLFLLGISLLMTLGLGATVSAATISGGIERENAALEAKATNDTIGLNIRLKSITKSSITFVWSKPAGVNNVQLYLYNKNTGKLAAKASSTGTSVKISGLKVGTFYIVDSYINGIGYLRYADGIGTATSKLSISKKVANSSTGKYSFQVKVQDTCSGIQVKAYNMKSKKTTTKNVSTNPFSISLKKNVVYKVSLRPYTTYAGSKKVYGATATTYVMFPPAYKSGKIVTSTSGKVTWKKVSGVSGYYVYLKKPGSSTYKKVATTKGTSYTIKNMKKYKNYYLEVVGYKKVGKKYYKSEPGINRYFYIR